jgi:arabinogalactan endo-1,4-beta-galactosidase
LPSLEKAGAVYRDGGKPGDAIEILAAHGCNLFRVRLFVHPDRDFAHTGGAVQDLDSVIALARRIKGTGAAFLLDLHYSDSWADPGHQPTPAAWVGLAPAALASKVHDYTTDVLVRCAAAGVAPDLVQVGNEVTAGILWPTAQLYKAQGAAEDQQWNTFAQLLNAGAQAVREQSATQHHPMKVVLHIHGGGRDVPVWFFQKLQRTPVDFDIIGLSFYPAWGDSLGKLKSSLSQLIDSYHKDVLICETSYPWKPLQDVQESAMTWPATAAGQRQFLTDLVALLHTQPGGHGLGYVWWYPEAVPLAGLNIWRGGAEGWFDGSGNLLPAAQVLDPVLR